MKFSYSTPILANEFSTEKIFRIKIGSAFLCYFLLQRQKKVACLILNKEGARGAFSFVKDNSHLKK